MNILVLGGSGMAGHVIALYLREHGHNVTTLSAKHRLDAATILIDVANTTDLAAFLDSHQFDAIINCTAVLVQASEQAKHTATFINAHLPHWLESRYQNTPTKLIHLSTDGVFSGQQKQYHESSPYDGQDFYGRSKALGEIINQKDLTIRMSIIGPALQPNNSSLLNWFLTNREHQLTGYTNVLWNGVTTLELAKGIEAALQQNISGLCHFAPDSLISKFDLLALCKQAFARTVQLAKSETPVFERALTSTRTDFNFQISDYAAMIQDVKTWIDSHARLYPHYQS